MTASFLSGIVAFVRAVPILDKWFTQLTSLYFKKKAEEIRVGEVTIDQKRTAIINSIQKAETDEELIALSVVLDDFNRGRVSQ